MRIVIVAVGKLREAPLRAVADDYFARIRRYTACEEREVKSSDGLAAKIPEGSTVVALEIFGESLTSTALSRRVDEWSRRNKGIVTFLIGGADGIPAGVSRRADAQVSLSTLTLPHRLVRVILAEQIYRAMTLLRGEPYARE